MNISERFYYHIICTFQVFVELIITYTNLNYWHNLILQKKMAQNTVPCQRQWLFSCPYPNT